MRRLIAVNDPRIPLLDSQELQELLDVIGQEAMSELVSLFANDTSPRLAAIEAAVIERDPKLVSSAAHSFKGAAAGVGALRVAALARKMEEDARRGSVEMAGDLLSRLRVETNRAVTELREFVA